MIFAGDRCFAGAVVVVVDEAPRDAPVRSRAGEAEGFIPVTAVSLSHSSPGWVSVSQTFTVGKVGWSGGVIVDWPLHTAHVRRANKSSFCVIR